jgi:hypothetical protein
MDWLLFFIVVVALIAYSWFLGRVPRPLKPEPQPPERIEPGFKSPTGEPYFDLTKYRSHFNPPKFVAMTDAPVVWTTLSDFLSGYPMVSDRLYEEAQRRWDSALSSAAGQPPMNATEFLEACTTTHRLPPMTDDELAAFMHAYPGVVNFPHPDGWSPRPCKATERSPPPDALRKAVLEHEIHQGSRVMSGIIRRIGVLAWWLGAIVVAAALCLSAYALSQLPTCSDGLFKHCDVIVGMLAASGFMVVIVTGILWAITFVLTGSFWRPPRSEG